MLPFSAYSGSAKARLWIAVVSAGLVLIAVFAPSYPQPESYHRFAKEHSILGIPNFWNVISNVPFLVVAVVSLARLRSTRTKERTAVAFIVGVFLTSLGSAHYHWNPTTQTLFWDRLPMTIAFSSAVAGLIGRKIDPHLGGQLLWPLILLSAGTVIYWRWSAWIGRGNLIPYGVVQFGTMALVLGILLRVKDRSRDQSFLWLAFGFYTLAKVFEGFDQQIGSVLQFMGGHPIKHLAAALGCWFMWRGVFDKRPASVQHRPASV